MTTVLQLGNPTTTTPAIPSRSSILPQSLREQLIEAAIAPFSCTDEERLNACEQFYQRNRLIGAKEQQAWLKRCGMSQAEIEDVITRRIRLEKFKQATWGHQLDYYFRQRKRELDRVVYSCLKTKDLRMALEFYLSVENEEQIFAELAREYSTGPEAKFGGLIGPVELGTLSPMLAGLLRISQSGQLWPPQPFGEWQVIVRLEAFIPAQLDEPMRQRLLNELFEAWLQERYRQLS